MKPPFREFGQFTLAAISSKPGDVKSDERHSFDGREAMLMAFLQCRVENGEL